MAKISGNISADARLIIVKESDWTVESNTTETGGAFEISGLTAGAKTVISRAAGGECVGYGGVNAVEPPFIDFTDFKFWDLGSGYGYGVIDGKFIFGYIPEIYDEIEEEYIFQPDFQLMFKQEFGNQFHTNNEMGSATKAKFNLKLVEPEATDQPYINTITLNGYDSGGEPIGVNLLYAGGEGAAYIGPSGLELIADMFMQAGDPPSSSPPVRWLGDPIRFQPLGDVSNYGPFDDWYVEKIYFNAPDAGLVTAPYWRNTSYRGQDKWTAGANTSWQAGFNGWQMVCNDNAHPAFLNVTGSWATDFRPERMLITAQITGNFVGKQLWVQESNGTNIGEFNLPSIYYQGSGYARCVVELGSGINNIGRIALMMDNDAYDPVTIKVREIIFEY